MQEALMKRFENASHFVAAAMSKGLQHSVLLVTFRKGRELNNKLLLGFIFATFERRDIVHRIIRGDSFESSSKYCYIVRLCLFGAVPD